MITQYSSQSTRRALIADCHVALRAGAVRTVDDVAPLLMIVADTPWKQVALIAQEISGAALATLGLNHRQGNLKIIAVELCEPEAKRLLDLKDLAVLTGAMMALTTDTLV